MERTKGPGHVEPAHILTRTNKDADPRGISLALRPRPKAAFQGLPFLHQILLPKTANSVPLAWRDNAPLRTCSLPSGPCASSKIPPTTGWLSSSFLVSHTKPCHCLLRFSEHCPWPHRRRGVPRILSATPPGLGCNWHATTRLYIIPVIPGPPKPSRADLDNTPRVCRTTATKHAKDVLSRRLPV